MPAGENRHKRALNNSFLAEDDLAYRFPHPGDIGKSGLCLGHHFLVACFANAGVLVPGDYAHVVYPCCGRGGMWPEFPDRPLKHRICSSRREHLDALLLLTILTTVTIS